jgi:drug/metabolite transporter (DMT)-like permease
MTHRAAARGLVLVALTWGVSFVVIKIALGAISPLLFLSVRFLLASLLVVGWWRGISRAELRGGLLLALLFWGGFVFQTVGLVWTTPARSAFITGLSTPLVPIVAFAAFRAVPRPAMVAGIVVAALGTGLLTDPRGAGLNRGDLLTVGCAVLFACQIVAAGHYARRLRPERLLVVELTATAVLSALALPVLETPRFVPGAGPLLALAFVSVTATLTFWFQLRAQQQVSPAETALIFTLEPVFAALASFLMLGERLTPLQAAGGALILLGTALPELWRSSPPPGGPAPTRERRAAAPSRAAPPPAGA